MADYKRMVSYMYQYENGLKRKNVGYARIEARNGQVKISLHMQLLGQLDSIFPTYLIQRGNNGVNLIYLGDTVLKNQVMDSRLTADENNIMNSGYKLSDMGGLLLFLHDNIFFASEWDDKPIVAAELLEALKPKKPEVSQEDDLPEADLSALSDSKHPESLSPEGFSLAEEIHMPKYMLPRGWKTIERQHKQAEYASEQVNPVLEAAVLNVRVQEPDIPEEGKDNNLPGATEAGNRESIPSDIIMETEFPVEMEVDLPGEAALSKKAMEEEQTAEGEAVSEESTSEEGVYAAEEAGLEGEYEGSGGEEVGRAQAGDESVKAAQEQEESPEHLVAKHFFDIYPRIYPFEDNEIILCVKIEPKDIGMLPNDLWALSNNSFLMHGFYCYHHLIFAKLKDRYGCRYILGVPGIYHNRERFMARMFGFENFKSIRKRELQQGDFGYWHIDVNF